jgi:predicted nucleic acid-binding protein
VPEGLLYLDASALVKLVAAEPESAALATFLGEWEGRITSRISVVEVSRAARRQAVPEVIDRAAEVLDAVAFVELDAEVAGLAGTLGPAALRSLDAVHLASALSVASDVESFVTYDVRLRDAAGRAGLAVQAPA